MPPDVMRFRRLAFVFQTGVSLFAGSQFPRALLILPADASHVQKVQVLFQQVLLPFLPDSEVEQLLSFPLQPV